MDSHAATTEQAILDAARRLFMAHGYRRVSTRQIAEACGLTQPAIYHHFGGKEELYIAVLNAELTRLGGAIARIVGRHREAEAALSEIAKFVLSSTDYDFALMRRDMSLEISAGAQEAVRNAFVTRVVLPIAGVLQPVIDDPRNAYPGYSPVAAAFLFLSVIAHFLEEQVDERADAGGVMPIEHVSKLAASMVLRGLWSSEGP